MKTLRYIILPLLAITLSVTTTSAASKQQKGGVPTLNANAKNKSAYDAKRSAAAANAAVRRGAPQSATTTEVPMTESSSLFRHTATPVASSSARYEMSGSQSSGSSMPVFNYRSTQDAKGGKTGGGFSGGASASGLMSSGSTYASTATGGAGASTTTLPSRPRRVDANGNGIDDDDEGFDDEGEGWGYTGDPFDTPLGDMAWPLVLLAIAYGVLRMAYKRKRGV
ncbi:MAG: hypothetical protein J5902_06535 [Paludibacteraceae bacterium]|nr:hypothetical protein [Paludibacteraceae bacterium]